MNQFNWSEPELFAYEKEIKRIRDNIAAMDYQLDQAKAIGEAKGKAIGVKKTAVNMIKQNLDNSLISSVTGLSIDEILKLKNKH